MSNDGIPEDRIRRPGQHCRLDHRGEFAGFSAKSGESQNLVAVGADERFEESARLGGRVRPEHGVDRQQDANMPVAVLGDTIEDAENVEWRSRRIRALEHGHDGAAKGFDFFACEPQKFGAENGR